MLWERVPLVQRIVLTVALIAFVLFLFLFVCIKSADRGKEGAEALNNRKAVYLEDSDGNGAFFECKSSICYALDGQLTFSDRNENVYHAVVVFSDEKISAYAPEETEDGWVYKSTTALGTKGGQKVYLEITGISAFEKKNQVPKEKDVRQVISLCVGK